ncbi:MAG: hypothetical protein J7L71_04185, partial [Spirochaetaceae bacterium]|nr:hypothetical protein [Spirochaetaceae bacterium]
YIEPSELLTEDEIITTEEKQSIIAEIDKDFSSSMGSESPINQGLAKSRGIRFPIIVISGAVIVTIIVLFWSSNLLWKNFDTQSTNTVSESSDSEWEILNKYMEESNKKLEDKNIEITGYKDEIVNYDQRLTTLRDLLTIKNDTEQRLSMEKEKLQAEGVSETELGKRLDAFEKSLTSSISPGMVSFYDLSIDEINGQIDQILDKKTVSEEKLATSLGEKDELITENNKLQVEIKIKQDESPQITQILDTVNRLNEISAQNEYDRFVRNQISENYTIIFQDLDNNKPNDALKKLDNLQDLFQNNKNIKDYNSIDQLYMQINIADKLKEYINKYLSMENIAKLEKVKYEEISREIEALDSNKGGKSEIQALASEPGISPRLPDQSEKVRDSGEMIFLGVITFIQFDRIVIEPISGLDIQVGKEFYIFNRKNRSEILGSGKISDVSGINISGILDNSSDLLLSPEADDLIFVRADTIN